MSRKDTAFRLLSSTGSAVFSQVLRTGVVLGTNLLLRRLVAPADWGLWNWAEPLFLVLGALRDLGLATHVVRTKPRPYGNLLGFELAWGAVLAVAVLAGAPLLAHAYADPSPLTVPVLRALTLFFLFETLATVPLVFFEADLTVRRALVPEVLRSATYAVTSIALALRGFGIWSIVAGSVAAAAIYALTLWVRAFRDLPLTWARGRTLALVRQSLPLAAVWFLVLANTYVDPFVLGARFTGAVVGTYMFAYTVAFLVTRIMAVPVVRSLYPALVAYRDDPERLSEVYRLATVLLLVLEVPVALFLFLNAEVVLGLLGGARWAAGAPYLRILCFAPLADPLGRFGGDLLVACHRDRVWVAALLATLASFVGLGVVLTGRIDAFGMAIADLVPAGALVMAWGVRGVSPKGFKRLVAELVQVYLIPLPLFALAALAAGGDPGRRLVLSSGAFALAALVYALRFGRGFVTFFRRPVEAVPAAP